VTLLVIPFYKREDLVKRLFSNLYDNLPELKKLGIEIVVINDSPDYPALAKELESQGHLLADVSVRVIENSKNLGFVKSCNKAFEIAVNEKRNAIILNSDCLITPGALTEIVNVAQLDEKIGFVCPRSNNASIASLPSENQYRSLGTKEAFNNSSKVFPLLPRFSYVPTAVGFCLLIKWEILADFGFFDEIYGIGYQEENDLVLRANRSGYRAALANHAFVWHEGSQSFKVAESAPKKREAKNLKILIKRYPYYLKLVQRFMQSPERRAEELVVAAVLNEKPLIVFDFTHIGTYFNGTFEAAIKIAFSTIRNASAKFNFGLMVDIPAWHFHGLDDWNHVIRIDPLDESLRAAAIIRIGQPFNAAQLRRVFKGGAICIIYMLDTIAMDCGENSLEFDVSVWDKTMRFSSAVLAISDFTKLQLENRFQTGNETVLRTSYLSLDVEDYKPSQAGQKEIEEPYIFVVGNSFAHKFVKETCDYLVSHTDHKIVALGFTANAKANSPVRNVESGSLSEFELEKLWLGASAVVFPSHYEGFGLPVLHALARKKPVFTRKTILNQELKVQLADSLNIHTYATSSDLVEKINQGIPDWVNSDNRNPEPFSWKNSAENLVETIVEELESITFEKILARTKVAIYDLGPQFSSGLVTPAAMAGKKLESLIETLLRSPLIKKITTAVYKVYRRLK
jgi:GT2 family glycosyltransferase